MENWKPVVGWESLYEVSDQGSVRSIKRYGFTLLGKREYGGKSVKPITRKDGYVVVNLTVGKSRKQKFVHNIVLEAFVGERPSKNHACHNDGNKLNNCVSNLRWDSVSGNMKDKIKHGTWQGGSKGTLSKLTEDQAKEVKYSDKPISYFAEKHNMSISGLKKIRYGESWKHI